MNFRSTFVLLAFLALLVGAFFVVRKKSPPGEEFEEPKLFEGIDRDRIERVRVDRHGEGAYRVVLERTEEGWRMKEPLDVPADDAVARQFVDDFAHNPGPLVVDLRENPSVDLAPYGLRPPDVRAVIDYELRGPKDRPEEKVRRRLLVGGEDFEKDWVFCGLGSPLVPGEESEWKPHSVRRTRANVWNTVNRSVNDFRDHRVFTIPSWKAEGIEVKKDGETVLALEKIDGVWSVSAPRRDRADPTVASGFVSQVLGWRIHSFADDAPGPDSGYGLDPAKREVVVRGGGTAERLRLGNERDADGILARRDEMKFVWGLEPGDVAALDRNPLEFLDRKVFRHFRDEVKEVRLGTGAGEILLAKDGFQWKIRSPREMDADREKVDDLLGSIERLEITSFEPPSDPPGKMPGEESARSIRVVAGTKDLQTTLLVGSEAEGGGASYVRREGSENVGRIPVEALAFLEARYLDYATREIVSFSEFDLAAIEIEAKPPEPETQPASPEPAERRRARWVRTETNRWERAGEEGEAKAFADALDEIVKMRGEAAESDSTDGFPFDDPLLVIRFFKGSPASRPAEGTAPSAEVKVTERDHVFYAAAPSGLVYRLSVDLVSKLRALP